MNPNHPVFGGKIDSSYEERNFKEEVPGITIRDYIAIEMGKALIIRYGSGGKKGTAEQAYEFADALIAESNK